MMKSLSFLLWFRGDFEVGLTLVILVDPQMNGFAFRFAIAVLEDIYVLLFDHFILDINELVLSFHRSGFFGDLLFELFDLVFKIFDSVF